MTICAYLPSLGVGLLLIISSPRNARAELPLRQGDLTVEVEGRFTETTRIVVRQRSRLLARIDPNPGGGVGAGSFSVGFTAGNNVLATWSCGTYCTVAVLFTSNGRQLASFGIHEGSPSRELAVAFPAFDASGLCDVVEVIDLRTGRAVQLTEIASNHQDIYVVGGQARRLGGEVLRKSLEIATVGRPGMRTRSAFGFEIAVELVDTLWK